MIVMIGPCHVGRNSHYQKGKGCFIMMMVNGDGVYLTFSSFFVDFDFGATERKKSLSLFCSSVCGSLLIGSHLYFWLCQRPYDVTSEESASVQRSQFTTGMTEEIQIIK
jgi:hypothetical protein